jgi:hypothetical protein
MAPYQPSDAELDAYGTVFVTSRFASRLLGVALWGKHFEYLNWEASYLSCVGIQAFMVFSSFSTFFKLSKEKRKGHLRFLVFSVALLSMTSVAWSLQVWGVFRNLFRAGPDPKSYVEAFRADGMNEMVRRAQIVTVACTDATIIAADVLMVRRSPWL